MPFAPFYNSISMLLVTLKKSESKPLFAGRRGRRSPYLPLPIIALLLCGALMLGGCAVRGYPSTYSFPYSSSDTTLSFMAGAEQSNPLDKLTNPYWNPYIAETPAPVREPRSAHDIVGTEFFAAFYPNFNDLLINYGGQQVYMNMSRVDSYKALYDRVEATIIKAMEHVINVLQENHGDAYALLYTYEIPNWKILVTFDRNFPRQLSSILRSACHCEFTIDEGLIRMRVYFDDARAILAKKPASSVYGVSTQLAYLNTIFDDDGNEKPYEHYDISDRYLLTLVEPVARRSITRISDGWYNPRSDNTRKHVGVDICANRDTPIYSCSGGSVLYIGGNNMSGNYVIILDDYGFEYHYYHMVRITTFLKPGDRVEAGDLIGHVGNTGNSDTDHVHLTVISPDFTYINPYLMIMRMRELEG